MQSVPRDIGATIACDVILWNRPVQDFSSTHAETADAVETADAASGEWDRDKRCGSGASDVTERSPLPVAEHEHEKVNKVALEQRRPQFCPRVSLMLEDEVISSQEPALGKRATVSITPAQMSRRGPVGQFRRHTFIHAVAPPQTPSPASLNRGPSMSSQPLAYFLNKVDLTTPKTRSPEFLRRERGQWTPTILTTPDNRERILTPLMTPPAFPF